MRRSSPGTTLTPGTRIGMLTVEGPADSLRGEASSTVVCDCGTSKPLPNWQLRSLKYQPQSCGCIRKERARIGTTTHGLATGRVATRHPLYGTWLTMKSRCTNPRVASFKNYGGRGIYVCERWRTDFAAFVEDVGPRPPNTTLDRKDNDGPYCKDNCQWSTAKEQRANRRTA